MQPVKLKALIKKRRSIFPNTYTGEQIPDDIILQILEAANWAPTHKKTEPWRFKILQNHGREKLANFMADWYEEYTPRDKFSPKKHEKLKKKPLSAPTVIAICLHRDPSESIPEWEEIAAVAMAVQNMWLMCTAYDIGCYWSSPKPVLAAKEILHLEKGEKCLGLFYMGYHTMPEVAGQRTPIADKIEFIR